MAGAFIPRQSDYQDRVYLGSVEDDVRDEA